MHNPLYGILLSMIHVLTSKWWGLHVTVKTTKMKEMTTVNTVDKLGGCFISWKVLKIGNDL